LKGAFEATELEYEHSHPLYKWFKNPVFSLRPSSSKHLHTCLTLCTRVIPLI